MPLETDDLVPYRVGDTVRILPDYASWWNSVYKYRMTDIEQEQTFSNTFAILYIDPPANGHGFTRDVVLVCGSITRIVPIEYITIPLNVKAVSYEPTIGDHVRVQPGYKDWYKRTFYEDGHLTAEILRSTFKVNTCDPVKEGQTRSAFIDNGSIACIVPVEYLAKTADPLPYGLTRDEKTLNQALGDCYTVFTDFPVLNPADDADFSKFLRLAQNIVLSRPAMRELGFGDQKEG